MISDSHITKSISVGVSTLPSAALLFLLITIVTLTDFVPCFKLTSVSQCLDLPLRHFNQYRRETKIQNILLTLHSLFRVNFRSLKVWESKLADQQVYILSDFDQNIGDNSFLWLSGVFLFSSINRLFWCQLRLKYFRPFVHNLKYTCKYCSQWKVEAFNENSTVLP